VSATADNATLVAAFERRLAGAPATTRKAYLRDVGVIVAPPFALSLATAGRSELSRVLATLRSRGLAGRSLARMLSAWRACFRVLVDDGVRADDPTAGLHAPKSPRHLPEALAPEEAARLCEIRDEGALDARDRALFELAYSCGLRLAELAGATLPALDLEAGEIRVLGKGAKERIVPVGAAARRALQHWLTVRAGLAAPGESALFLTRRGVPLSPRAIQARVAHRARQQGLDRHVHPHMLRHSFASHLLQSSGDLRAVQELLGHASIASTQVYTHLDHQALARAYDAAHPRARKPSRRS